MLSILQENDIKYLVVGAYAMAVHGFPRATGDMDIFIRPDSENAKRVYRAMMLFGAPMESVSSEDFEKKGTVFQIGLAPRRIDIINDIDGLSFDEAREDCITVELEGLKIPVISKRNLIKNKLASGRDKDKLDAENLSES
jgi:hypothetical protein